MIIIKKVRQYPKQKECKNDHQYPRENTDSCYRWGSQGLKIKEEGFPQGLLCPLSSDQNHKFGWPFISGSSHLLPVHTLNFTINVGWIIKPDLHFPINDQILQNPKEWTWTYFPEQQN